MQMNETQINKNTTRVKLPVSTSLSLLVKNMQNKKISETILKIVEYINITLFKYINQNKNNQKSIEIKLVYINNLITEKLFKKKNPLHTYNLSAKTKKTNKFNYTMTSIENNKNNKSNTNPEILNELINNNINSNYIKLKIKNKIKSEHDKYKIKELEYLQRISELQSELNLSQKNSEKLISENNELINYINVSSDVNRKNKMSRTNSVDFLFKKEQKNENYFQINDNQVKYINKNHKNDKLNKVQPLSSLSENNGMKNLKRRLNQRNNKQDKISIVDAYFHSNINLHKNRYRQHLATSLSDLNYKYQVGNGYLRNKFYKLKKDIFDKTNHLKQIKNLLNDIK